jgi:hypothetical protein
MLNKTTLSKLDRSKINLPLQLKEILIGLCLGDLFIQKTNVNARIFFEQGTVHEGYLKHLYEQFKDYCLTEPKTYVRAPNSQTGKIHSRISFKTRSAPCFTEFYNLFYFEGKKIVPLNILLGFL